MHGDCVVRDLRGRLPVGANFGFVFDDNTAVVGPSIAVVERMPIESFTARLTRQAQTHSGVDSRTFDVPLQQTSDHPN